MLTSLAPNSICLDAIQLGDLGGQKGWRLGIIRLSAGDPVPTVSAVCVVSEARAGRQGVRVFRMMALTVDELVRGQGLAMEAMARMKAELLLVAGPRFELRADLASCMEKGGGKVLCQPRLEWCGWHMVMEVRGHRGGGSIEASGIRGGTGADAASV